jgi:hypothetical protein
MKIGMKITMISVHSSGQPSRKITICARIRNCSGVSAVSATISQAKARPIQVLHRRA